MKLDTFIIQLAILFLPGVVWARIDATWTRQSKPSDTEFFVRAFLFGITCHAIVYSASRLLDGRTNSSTSTTRPSSRHR